MFKIKGQPAIMIAFKPIWKPIVQKAVTGRSRRFRMRRTQPQWPDRLTSPGLYLRAGTHDMILNHVRAASSKVLASITLSKANKRDVDNPDICRNCGYSSCVYLTGYAGTSKTT